MRKLGSLTAFVCASALVAACGDDGEATDTEGHDTEQQVRGQQTPAPRNVVKNKGGERGREDEGGQFYKDRGSEDQTEQNRQFYAGCRAIGEIDGQARHYRGGEEIICFDGRHLPDDGPNTQKHQSGQNGGYPVIAQASYQH